MAVPFTSEELLKYLDQIGVSYEHHAHEAVFTVDEGADVKARIAGCHTKNLFLKDKKGNIVLVVAKDETRADLTALSKYLGMARFSFGNPDLLFEVLGVTPGSVTPFSLINDKDTQRVCRVVLDSAMMAHDVLNYHPLINTATISVLNEGFRSFLKECGHQIVICNLEQPNAA